METPDAMFAMITGTSTLGTCRTLRNVAQKAKTDAAIVEIGTFRARSACALALGSREVDGLPVWTIDCWDLPGEPRRPWEWMSDTDKAANVYMESTVATTARTQAELCGVRDHIRFIRGWSTLVAAKWAEINAAQKIGLLHIDGDKRPGHVLADYVAWSPFLINNAIIAWSNYDELSYKGVVSIVDKLLDTGRIKDFYLAPDQLALTRFVC